MKIFLIILLKTGEVVGACIVAIFFIGLGLGVIKFLELVITDPTSGIIALCLVVLGLAMFYIRIWFGSFTDWFSSNSTLADKIIDRFRK